MNLSYTSLEHFVMPFSKIPTDFLFCSVKEKESVFCRPENMCCRLEERNMLNILRVGKVQHCKALRIRFYVFYEEAIWCRTGPMAIKSFVYCHRCLWRLYHPDLNFHYESFSLVLFSSLFFSPSVANFVLLRGSLYIYIYIYSDCVFVSHLQ